MEFRRSAVTLLALALLADAFNYNAEPCWNRTFHRRITKDNIVFPGGKTPWGLGVENRADCISRCQRRSSCRFVFYNSITKTCRLYSDVSPTDGVIESGWQYYGVSCNDYPVVISPEGVDDGDACDNGYHALLACSPQSCFNGGTWINLSTVCTPTLFKSSEAIILSGSTPQDILLNFDLQPGHLITIQVSGSTSYNDVRLVDDKGDSLYLVSLRWHLTPNRLVFNTKYGGSWGAEETYHNVPISNPNNYTLDILITDTEFKTYGDGKIIATNQQRFPFTNVRRVTFRDFQVIYKFKVGPDACPTWSALN